MKKYIVELEPGIFLAPWEGDPGRTCIEKKARRYNSVASATFGLAHARKYSDFPEAGILEVAQKPEGGAHGNA